MVSAAAPCASPNAMSAAAVARQPIDEAGFMSVPPARNSRPRLASFFAPAYHALARRKGRRGRRPAGRQDGSPLTPSEPGLAPSPSRTRVFPSSAMIIGPNRKHPKWTWGRDGEGGVCLILRTDTPLPARALDARDIAMLRIAFFQERRPEAA